MNCAALASYVPIATVACTEAGCCELQKEQEGLKDRRGTDRRAVALGPLGLG